MLRDKNIIWLLISYILIQLATIFFGIGIFLFVYPIIYLIAIVYACIKISFAITQNTNLKVIIYLILLFFIANLVLFLIYLPTLIYNPEINWHLKGEAEQDPMILQAYFPPIFFIAAIVIIGLTSFIAKAVTVYRKQSA